MSKIKPFHPKRLPLDHLNYKSVAPFLKKAKIILEQYNNVLLNIKDPEILFSSFLTLEAIYSLNKNTTHLLTKSVLPDPILRYHSALQLKGRITKKLVCKLHQKIKQGVIDPVDLGRYRNRQNWIGPNGDRESAYFLPPESNKVNSLMNNLFAFKEKEPLLQLAIFIAQLLIIHPFMDGNGRVARALIPLFISNEKLLGAPLLFLSRYFSRNRIAYFRNLYNITETDAWESWIVFFLKGIISQGKDEMKRAKKIIALFNKMLKAYDSKTLYFLFSHPVFEQASITKKVLKKLIKDKWLTKKGKTFYFSELIEILKK